MENYASYIRHLVAQGGPRVSDYADLDQWVVDVHLAASANELSPAEIAEIRTAFADALSSETMQGFALTKPHGYSGDFEIIDRTYQIRVSSQPHLASWDMFYHQHAAPKAVRNRKKYFHRLLDRNAARKTSFNVLEIAVGPGRSMFEWFSKNPTAAAFIDCVEIDPKAIEYSSRLNHQFLDRINFIQKNALLFRPHRKYDFIWAAGIFDYFDDRLFVSLLQRLLPALADGGEIVVGNFSDRNPSRPYMELVGDWVLHHRTGEHLAELARQSGVTSERIFIGTEPEQVNLFLHVSRESKAHSARLAA